MCNEIDRKNTRNIKFKRNSKKYNCVTHYI